MEILNEKFDQYVEVAIEKMPDAFKKFIGEIEIIVDDFPSEEQCPKKEGVIFLGCYTGTPLSQRGRLNVLWYPSKIYLYRKNILKVCGSEESVQNQIFLTLIHEFGHALGYSEEALQKRGVAGKA